MIRQTVMSAPTPKESQRELAEKRDARSSSPCASAVVTSGVTIGIKWKGAWQYVKAMLLIPVAASDSAPSRPTIAVSTEDNRGSSPSEKKAGIAMAHKPPISSRKPTLRLRPLSSQTEMGSSSVTTSDFSPLCTLSSLRDTSFRRPIVNESSALFAEWSTKCPP